MTTNLIDKISPVLDCTPPLPENIQGIMGRLKTFSEYKIANTKLSRKQLTYLLNDLLHDLETEIKELDNPDSLIEKAVNDIASDFGMIEHDVIANTFEYLEQKVRENTWDMQAFNLKKDMLASLQDFNQDKYDI